MPSIRPLLLLDVDGVLNPIGRLPSDGVPDGFHEHRIAGLRVLLNPSHGVWIRELATRYEVAWATSWEHDANDLIAPLLGVPVDLPVVTFEASDAGWMVKLPAIAAFAADRPTAWVDDQISDADRAWADARQAPTLFVSTDSRIGWTRDHIDQLLTFADEIQTV
jgi:hypothetical protein